jgi:hypothetical protein
MTPAPFRARIASHNRHAVFLAVCALLGASLLWNLAYFFFVLILLGLTTAVRGDFGPAIPAWIPGTAGILAGILLVWGAADQFFRRFEGPPDRPIIGWHLIREVLLMPVRVTYAVWGNLSAIRQLDHHDIDRAWELLMAIHGAGRARLTELSLVEPNPRQLHKLLEVLQLTGYIDLHQGQDDWFYTVRSVETESLHRMLPDAVPTNSV